MRKLKKIDAGYHMLMILSQVDGKFDESEEKVIIDYLNNSYPNKIDVKKELSILNDISSKDYFLHFNNSMNDFYEDSDEHERVKFLDFAVKLATADKKVSVEENKYLKELFFAWDADHEE